MTDLVLDVDAMKADLALATDQALALADRLAIEVTRHSSSVFRTARELQEKNLEVRQLRRAIKAEVAG